MCLVSVPLTYSSQLPEKFPFRADTLIRPDWNVLPLLSSTMVVLPWDLLRPHRLITSRVGRNSASWSSSSIVEIAIVPFSFHFSLSGLTDTAHVAWPYR
jgi:hypothetical protein